MVYWEMHYQKQTNMIIQAEQGPLFKEVPLFNATGFRYQEVKSHNL